MPRSHENEDESDEMVLGVLALVRIQALEKANQREEKEKARSRYPNFEKTKERAARAIAPLKPADEQSIAPKDMLFAARKTNASQHLPEHYLVYFLLVGLLDYKDLGQWEKLAYSIPVDFNGTAYLIEHRKFGLGLFAADPETQEGDATAIVDLIRKAVKAARPYFEHLANEAAEGSKLNLKNHSRGLYDRFDFLRKAFHEKQEEAELRKDERVDDRFDFLRKAFHEKQEEAELRKDERVVEKEVTENGMIRWESFLMPVVKLRREARWFGLAAVEAFFSWTEHVFIHIAVLRGACTTGREVSQLADADWSTKLKAALDIEEPEMWILYDKLAIIRRQLRNYVAHGAFGKDGEEFSFHSSAGAVPLRLPHRRKRDPFRFGSGVDLDPTQAFDIIARFESHLWTGWRARAKFCIQDYELPTILSMAADGTYERAMSSEQTMIDFTEQLAKRIDDAANMDW